MEQDSGFFSKLVSIAWWRGIFERMGKYFGYGLAVLIGLPLVLQFGYNQFSMRNQQNAVDTTRDATLMTVNGTPITQGQYQMALRSQRDLPSGEGFAMAQGETLYAQSAGAVIAQEAKRLGVTANAAEVDKAIDAQRAAMGKEVTTSEFEARIQQATGMSLADYRNYLAHDSKMLYPALLEKFKAEEKVSDADAKNLANEVKLVNVLIPTTSATVMAAPGTKRLSDAEAKKKADDLLAKAKSGGDILAIAHADSADPSAKTANKAPFAAEYNGIPGLTSTSSVGIYGKDFEEAIHKTPAGGFTDVIKVSGFSPGYVFAKVLERRNAPPKGYDAKKALDAYKTQKAQEKLATLLKEKVNNAKVVFNDPDKQAYYDYFQLERKQLAPQMGATDPADLPAPGEVDKLKSQVQTEFEGVLKRHPDDSVAATIVAKNLKEKLNAPTTPASEKAAIQDRLITLYNTVLKNTEDQTTRMALANLYLEKKDFKNALAQYDMESRLVNASEGDDAQSLTQSATSHQQLMSGYLRLSKTPGVDANSASAGAVAAAKEQTKFNDDMTKAIAARQKEQAASPSPSGLPPGMTLPKGFKMPPGAKIISPSGTAPAPSGTKGAVTPESKLPTSTAPTEKPGATNGVPAPTSGTMGNTSLVPAGSGTKSPPAGGGANR